MRTLQSLLVGFSAMAMILAPCRIADAHQTQSNPFHSNPFHSHGNPFHSGTGTGTGKIQIFTCGPDPFNAVSYTNIGRGLYITTHLGYCDVECDGAGGDWEGLKDIPFQSLSFDYQNPQPACNPNDFEFNVILEGPNAATNEDDIYYFGCGPGGPGQRGFSLVSDLGNGFSRYTLVQGALTDNGGATTPATVSGIILMQFSPFPKAFPNTNVFGNVLLNGKLRPAKSTVPLVCPQNTGDSQGPRFPCTYTDCSGATD
jgi:hypothetical protein